MQTTKCGDEVENGKPAPDCFRATAMKMGAAPEECLVIEDAPSGVEAATAASMRVVVVPSLRDPNAYPKPDPSCKFGRFLQLLISRELCNAGCKEAVEGSPWAKAGIVLGALYRHCPCCAGCCAVLPSLFDFRPEAYGLPPFEDYVVGEVVPVAPPWCLKGTVVKGFGRGSRELGIPTANLDSKSLQVRFLSACLPSSLTMYRCDQGMATGILTG